MPKRFYDPETKRLRIKSKCTLCGEERTIRYDHYKNRYLDEGKNLKCRACANVKSFRGSHSSGYVIRHYKSFPRIYWKLLKQMSKKNGQLKEHRAVLAIYYNRPLIKGEVVHHRNGVRDDNRVENLELCLIRQPMGQRFNDLIEENRILRKIIKEAGICL